MEKVISQWNQINESDFYENDEAVVLSILRDENSANPEHFLLPWVTWQNFSLRYQYNIKQTSDENKEKYQLGDLVDPIPNSPN